MMRKRRGRRAVRSERVRERQERQVTHSRGKREPETPLPKILQKSIACAVIFVLLIALKLLLPGNLTSMRGTLGEWLVRDADFEEAFSALGRSLSGENDIVAALGDAYVAVFGGNDLQEVSGTLLAAETDTLTQSLLLAQKELPARAVAQQEVLGFDYTAPLSGEVTSPFGWRIEPDGSAEEFHYGIDLAGEEGETIVCFADGTVGAVAESTELGKYVTVSHENGYSTLYAHCSSICVAAGESVTRGGKIACVGQTGHATGPHLHFEVHDDEGNYLNPIYYAAS